VARFDELTRLVDDVNSRFRAVSGEADLLPPTSLPLQSDSAPEAGFLRLVSWLWSRYNETGRIALEALMSVSSIALSAQSIDHLRDSELLRTFMQHHLDQAAVDDRRKMEQAAAWLSSHCGGVPQDPDAWQSLLHELCDEAEGFLRDLGTVIERLASTELAPEFSQLLRARLDRTVPAHEVDDMIDELKPLYGLEYLDTRAFRDRNYQAWRQRMRLLAADRDARPYVRGLIDQALSQHVQAEPAPLSGDEIMDVFGLRPGPEVGRLKRRAEELSSLGAQTKRHLVRVLASENGIAPLIPVDDI
jgi:hypothetical protein